MTKKMIAIAIAAAGMVALAGQITKADPVPIVVQAKVPADAMKPVADNTPTEIARIHIPTGGNWIVSGLVNMYWNVVHSGVVWTGASISEGHPRLVANGTCPFTSQDIANNRSNFMQTLAIPGTLMVIPEGGEDLVLVGYSLEWAPASTAKAWGSIMAVRNED